NIRGCELSTAKCDPLNGQAVSDGERTDPQRVQCYMAAPAEPDGDEIRHAEERAHTPNSDNRIGLAWKSAPELTDIGGGAADIDHNRVCEPRKIGAAAHGIGGAGRKTVDRQRSGLRGLRHRAVVLGDKEWRVQTRSADGRLERRDGVVREI